MRFLGASSLKEAAAELSVSVGNAKVLQYWLCGTPPRWRPGWRRRRADVDDEAERYVEALLRLRCPKPCRARPEEAEELATAIILRAARPGGDAPSEEFVTSLHERLAAELDGPRSAPAGGARRRFVQGASIAAAAAAAGVLTDRALLRDSPDATTAQASTLQSDKGSWHTVAASSELPHGAVQAFCTGTVTGFVAQLDGRLRTVSEVCTHQGCRLVLDRPAEQLDCRVTTRCSCSPGRRVPRPSGPAGRRVSPRSTRRAPRRAARPTP
ncbi:Rieske 2Fe-2S domain-containing protein [Streptomyces violascens]|uniref:Rieske 2Fe-2S domain-containing protein n=1 Tax=Streptomyces violascens TaxID=67381 RepID=UPI003690F274